MKHVITQAEIEPLAQGAEFPFPRGAVFTPAARDLASANVVGRRAVGN